MSLKNSLLILFLLLINTGILSAQEYSLNVKFKHPNNVVFTGEEVTVSLQKKENGKFITVSPDDVKVSDTSKVKMPLGTLLKTTKDSSGNSLPNNNPTTYTYKAPEIMPANPIVTITMFVKNSKGAFITVTKDIFVMAKNWSIFKVETTAYSCDEKLNQGYTYTLAETEEYYFGVNDDLSLAPQDWATRAIPETAAGAAPCNRNVISSVVIKPGKGEVIRITGGKAIIENNSLKFSLKGTIHTSGPGFKVISVGGQVIMNTEPDEDAADASLTEYGVQETPMLNWLTYKDGFWEDKSAPQGTDAMKSSYIMQIRPETMLPLPYLEFKKTK